jgi:hypothetical protein
MKIKIKTLEIAGLASALQALRLPYKKECRSNIIFKDYGVYSMIDSPDLNEWYFRSKGRIHPNDLQLMSTLVKRGDEHCKCLRALVVYAEIEAPVWFYRELETYRIGRERLSSESTMHSECKGLSGEELEQAKDNIPMGHIQKTIDMFSYPTLRRIYLQRHNHRLPMWHDFCDWIKSLPLANELILPDYEKDSNR